MYEPASLGMFQCRLQRILCDFEVIMFFRKDPPQTEGRRDAHPLIKTSPEWAVGSRTRSWGSELAATGRRGAWEDASLGPLL